MKTVFDYETIVYNHIDRLSELTAHLLDEGEHLFTESKVETYRSMVIYYETLLCPFETKEYIELADPIKADLKNISPKQSVEFFLQIQKLLRLLIIQSFNAGFLSTRKSRFLEEQEED